MSWFGSALGLVSSIVTYPVRKVYSYFTQPKTPIIPRPPPIPRPHKIRSFKPRQRVSQDQLTISSEAIGETIMGLFRRSASNMDTRVWKYDRTLDYSVMLNTLRRHRVEINRLNAIGDRILLMNIFGKWIKITSAWLDPGHLDDIINDVIYAEKDSLHLLKLIMNNPTLGNAKLEFRVVHINRQPRQRRHDGGRFYPYVVTDPEVNLSAFQVYNERQLQQIISSNIQLTHCLAYSLNIQAKVKKVDTVIVSPKYCKGDFVPVTNLLDIANDNPHIRIALNRPGSNITYYPRKDNGQAKLHIAIVGTHYMPMAPGLFKYLGSLEKEDLLRPMSYDELEHFGKTSLCMIDDVTQHDIDNQRVFEKKEKVSSGCLYKVYWDVESTTWGDEHKAFLLCCKVKTPEGHFIKRRFRGRNCPKQFLDYVTSTCRATTGTIPTSPKETRWCRRNNSKLYFAQGDVSIIAHNANYDLSFLLKHISSNRLFGNVNRLKGAVVSYYGFHLNVIDSYCHLDCKLSDMPDRVSLPNKEMVKEVMPYALYDDDTINMTFVPLEQAMRYIKEDDKETFLKSADRFICNGYFRHMAYSEFYCDRDVDVLCECFEYFSDQIMEKLSLDLINFYTIASFSDYHLSINEAYEHVYETSGSLRQYLDKAVDGGRSHTYMQKPIVIKGKIVDFDAVSLYPSAMVRLANDIGGIPKGLAKKATVLDKEFLDKQDAYIAEVHFKRYRKHISFPPLNTMVQPDIDDKERCMHNKLRRNCSNCAEESYNSKKFLYILPPEGHVAHVSMIKLDDIIKYHQLLPEDYEILSAVYWDSGMQSKLGSEIQKLFDMRKIAKRAGQAVQIVYKLIMNSGYGKTLEKPHENRLELVHHKDDNDLEGYLCKNMHSLMSYSSVGDDKSIVSLKKTNNIHYNRAHIGVLILDMSKRIMYEVLDTLETVGGVCGYMDTDSLHFEEKYLEPLKTTFNQTYGRDLVGGNLGQFHTDFSVPGNVDFEPYSELFIGLMPKVYYHRVIGKDKDGELFRHDVYRMKGVPQESIRIYLQDNNLTGEELYTMLLEGREITFDLMAGGQVRFERNTDMTFVSRSKFTRNVRLKKSLIDNAMRIK